MFDYFRHAHGSMEAVAGVINHEEETCMRNTIHTIAKKDAANLLFVAI